MRGASNPTAFTQRKLKSLGRCFKGNPRLIWHYDWTDPGDKAKVFADSDHAGWKRTRRSTSCVALMLDGRLIRFLVLDARTGLH